MSGASQTGSAEIVAAIRAFEATPVAEKPAVLRSTFTTLEEIHTYPTHLELLNPWRLHGYPHIHLFPTIVWPLGAHECHILNYEWLRYFNMACKVRQFQCTQTERLY